MLTEYIEAAMKRARYKMLEDDEGFFGEIPGFDGLWGSAPTLEECRDELQSVLESWLLLGLQMKHQLPVLGKLDLNFKEKAPRKKKMTAETN